MRVVERVNRALHRLLDRYDDLYVLGEDIADPYGGAFRATRGLSGRHPCRVLSTPISESGILGVASGLALCGDRVIVEIMFGDFAALGFDQIVNVATKSVSMYGRRKRLRLVVRCPVGGHRGYGPTHSQSLQKHFIGIPNLTLYELSPWHDPEALIEEAFDRGEPAIIFEPKTLYAQPTGVDRHEFVDPERNWVRLRAAGDVPGDGAPNVVIIATGGSATTAMTAARTLTAEGSRAEVLVPGRLYPLDITPVTGLLAQAGTVCVAEESTAGGTWGSEVARHVNGRLWGVLAAPLLLLNSRDSVIPAAPHLERRVLLQADDILAAVRARRAVAVTVPRINSNDAVYTLTTWLVADGSRVAAGTPIAEVETSKAVEEIVAEVTGVLYHEVAPGAACAPGEVIGRCTASARPAVAVDAPAAAGPVGGGLIELSRAQRAVGEIVSAGRRDIPDGFVARRVRMDAVDRVTDCGLLELVVKAVGELRTDFPLCFASLTGDGTARPADGAHVSVTLDAGNGLYLPVLHDVESRAIGELADTLADYRMRAFRGTFTQRQLHGASIAVSWNHEPDVLFVQPVIPPGLACVLSVGGALDDATVGDDGALRASRVVHLGLAHDHRIVNGREAVRFLATLAAILTDPDRLEKLITPGGT